MMHAVGSMKKLSIAAAVAALTACSGPEGPAGPTGSTGSEGPNGAGCTATDNSDGTYTINCGSDEFVLSGSPGISTATVSGTITNAVTGAGIAGATITLVPAVAGLTITSDATGAYSAVLPVGAYALTIAASNFDSATATLSVLADQPVSLDFTLDPVGAVVVDPGATTTTNPGDTQNVAATATALDGTTVTAWSWTQTAGAPMTGLTDNGDGTASFTLGDLEAFKTAIWEHASVEGDDEHGVPDRLGILAVNPLVLEEAELVKLEVTATTSSGDYSAELTIHVDLPFKWANGLRNVPVDIPVLLHAPALTAGTHSWSLSSRPTASTATMMDPASRHAYFTPDVKGEYVVAYDDGTGAQSFSIWGGNWVGGISDIDANGRPIAGACEGCHKSGTGQLAPDKFNDWRETGHAEIFTTNYNTSAYWGEGCLVCHSVGYDPTATNGGIDEESGFALFLASLGSPAATNWSDLLANASTNAVAASGNIQCENCHGPNDSTLHMNGTLGADPNGWVLDPERISIASEVCGYCHGEPLRHARYQQWQTSPHGNYELAIAQATVENRPPNPFFAGAGHCARCHSAQGFLAWIKKADLSEMLQDTTQTIPDQIAELTAMGLTEGTVHPQTCATCHDPHKQGTTSGEPNTATVRIQDATPLLPAGYVAFGVGRGALCMMCHNTRNGSHNEATGTPTDFTAPHAAAQADVLLGENAFLVAPGGNRSPHSFIADTCTNCHMEKTPPPAELSYEQSGTNHTFRASTAICSECHGAGINGPALQETTHASLASVAGVAGEVIANVLAAEISADGAYYLIAHDPVADADSGATADVAVGAAPIAVTLTEIHGQLAVMLTLATGDAIPNPFTGVGTVTEVYAQLGNLMDNDPASTPAQLFDPAASAANSTVLKALWNYFLIEADGSFGIHNPDFTFDVLGTTYVELTALLP